MKISRAKKLMTEAYFLAIPEVLTLYFCCARQQHRRGQRITPAVPALQVCCESGVIRAEIDCGGENQQQHPRQLGESRLGGLQTSVRCLPLLYSLQAGVICTRRIRAGGPGLGVKRRPARRLAHACDHQGQAPAVRARHTKAGAQHSGRLGAGLMVLVAGTGGLLGALGDIGFDATYQVLEPQGPAGCRAVVRKTWFLMSAAEKFSP